MSQKNQNEDSLNSHLKVPKTSAFPLNSEQNKAVQAPFLPLLIVAGAGTGKTRTLTSRIVHLIEAGIPPGRICAITFTNKAANEMENRIAAMMPGEKGRTRAETPYIGTFHSLGARILRRECGIFRREPNFAIFDAHDSLELIKKAIKNSFQKSGTESPTIKKNKKAAPAFFARKISELKNLDPKSVFEKLDAQERQRVEIIFNAYESLLEQNNAFDFDDLIEKPTTAFKTHPEILKRYHTKFEALLVDEYQDINPKQYEFVKLLASGHRNFTAVGDDEQTIYSWRHADIKIFLDFDKDWPDASVYFLEENYRSTGTIIQSASAVVQNNRFRTPKKLWTSQRDGELITLYEAWGENDEAAWIAEKIKSLRAKNMKEVAVLYRTNAQSRAIEQALIRENISYKIYGGLKFYERREVKDAVAALRYASNKKDDLSRERLEKNLSKKKFAEFKSAVLNIIEPKPTDIIKIFLETFGYLNYLEENFINSEERQDNIAELITFASEFENLPPFLERLSLLQATDDTEKSETGTSPIHLSTVHLAKGLEFDAVFIAGAAEGLLPHIRSIDDESSLEEERRLMYVAMTRARKELFISFYGLPSRFIAEIPEGLIQTANEGGSDSGRGNQSKTENDNYDDGDYEENVVAW